MAGAAAITDIVLKLHTNSVWEKSIVFSFAGGDVIAITKIVPLNGILQKLVIDCGEATGANPTATVAIAAIDFSQAGLAENSNSHYNMHEPIAKNLSVIVTPSIDPVGDDYTVTLTLRGI